MVKGVGEFGRGRVDCEVRIEKGYIGVQGKGGRKKIYRVEVYLYLRKGCGDGFCVQEFGIMQFFLRLEIQDCKVKGMKMVLRIQRGRGGESFQLE